MPLISHRLDEVCGARPASRSDLPRSPHIPQSVGSHPEPTHLVVGREEPWRERAGRFGRSLGVVAGGGSGRGALCVAAPGWSMRRCLSWSSCALSRADGGEGRTCGRGEGGRWSLSPTRSYASSDVSTNLSSRQKSRSTLGPANEASWRESSSNQSHPSLSFDSKPRENAFFCPVRSTDDEKLVQQHHRQRAHSAVQSHTPPRPSSDPPLQLPRSARPSSACTALRTSSSVAKGAMAHRSATLDPALIVENMVEVGPRE
ncbi:hypothetical protein BJY59DRAFT_499623 [Rhodotorula toruloides]